MNKFKITLLILTSVFIGSCSSEESLNDLVTRAGAPLFEDMGNHTHPITTGNPYVQRYFDQGLTIDFAFNHAESARSFRAAQTLDPDCAMCYWGEALALGPNINVTSNGAVIMADHEREAAFTAIQKALLLKDSASQKEGDYIDALAKRYNGDLSSARAPLDQAYADAMRSLSQKYPDDDDAASLFAESLMNTMPWNYWIDADNPKPLTVEAIDKLEEVLARNPLHPMAIHLYIHAVESSSKPERAEAPADILLDLVPGAGHLVHMPSHIYWRVGRYADASKSNEMAAAVDEAYIAACNAQGFYPAAYYPHNIHFLWASSSMEGRSKVAIEAGEKVAKNVRIEMIDQFPGVEFFKTIPMQSLVQFGRWNEVLQQPAPAERLEYANGIWHYTRAIAFANTGELTMAKKEQAMLGAYKNTDDVLHLDSIYYPASMLLDIADSLALGEIAMAEDNTTEAIEQFTKAVTVQDELPYTEPPFWYYPTRLSLGKALLASGNASEAERVFKENLTRYPRNGWAMYGLIDALKAQNKDSSEIQQRFDIVWANADVTLTSPRF
jgi:tetratricopeptide (TPR) repeat protein|tara:strand:- start:4516 stop:6177 length:1662 start_codon:yes stop_codon:yes gene_type:complete